MAANLEAPGGLGGAMRRFLLAALLAAAFLAGCAAPAQPAGTPGCPGHWHAAFAVFIPGPARADGMDTPVLVDYAKPRADNGKAYYQLGEDPLMNLTVHMHQGSSPLGASVLHLEGGCTPLRQVFAVLETGLSPDGITLSGQHAQAGQAGTWSANATNGRSLVVRFASNSTWDAAPPTDPLRHQLQDGETVLVAFGRFDAAQVAGMEAQLPALSAW